MSHLLGILVLVATLSAEWFLLESRMTRLAFNRLAQIDGVYGLAAIWVLVSGLLMAYKYGKGSEYYAQYGLLYIKLGVFSVIGLLSIYPTVFYIRQRKGDPAEQLEVPPAIKVLILSQALLLLSMPVWAVLMAQGGKW